MATLGIDCDENGSITGRYYMGFGFGLGDNRSEIKTKFRWLFQLEGISASDDVHNTMFSLPPKRSARPSLGWKEYDVQHLTETVHYPFKPEWKTINLTLFDIHRCENKNRCNVVLEWIRKASMQPGADKGMYDPETAAWRPVVSAKLKRDAILVILNGCGYPLEKWRMENCYPQEVNWGELDMDSNEVLTVDITIRFDRAYQICDERENILNPNADGTDSPAGPSGNNGNNNGNIRLPARDLNFLGLR